MGSNHACETQSEVDHGHHQQGGDAAQKCQSALGPQRRGEDLQKRRQFMA